MAVIVVIFDDVNAKSCVQTCDSDGDYQWPMMGMVILNYLEMKMASCVLHVFIGTPCNHNNDNDDNNDNNIS